MEKALTAKNWFDRRKGESLIQLNDITKGAVALRYFTTRSVEMIDRTY